MFYFQHCLNLYLQVVHCNVAIVETSDQHVGVLCTAKLGFRKWWDLKTSGWMSTHMIPHLAQHWYLRSILEIWVFNNLLRKRRVFQPKEPFFSRVRILQLTPGKRGSSGRRQQPPQVLSAGTGCLTNWIVKHPNSKNITRSNTIQHKHHKM